MIVAYRNGAPVKLTDVASVTDDTENVRQAAWMNDVPAVIVNIQRQPGANIISVVDRIKLLLPQLTATLPKSVNVGILTDRTNTIRASVEDVQFELGLTVVLVVLVMFLFLRNVAATIIPSIAVPVSLIGTLGVMYLLGYSLNNLTLDGADHLHRICGGRRHRDDREHRALYRGRRGAPAGGAARRRANRVHHHFADHLADRGADPAAVHGRHRGPAVPRVRRHAERHHPGFGGGLADADAHDVLPSC